MVASSHRKSIVNFANGQKKTCEIELVDFDWLYVLCFGNKKSAKDCNEWCLKMFISCTTQSISERKKGWKQIFSDWYETLLYVLSLKMPFIFAQLKKNDCFEISFSELSLEGGAGGALAPLEFGSSVNPIPTRGGWLCPPHYC